MWCSTSTMILQFWDMWVWNNEENTSQNNPLCASKQLIIPPLRISSAIKYVISVWRVFYWGCEHSWGFTFNGVLMHFLLCIWYQLPEIL